MRFPLTLPTLFRSLNLDWPRPVGKSKVPYLCPLPIIPVDFRLFSEKAQGSVLLAVTPETLQRLGHCSDYGARGLGTPGDTELEGVWPICVPGSSCRHE